MPCDKKNPTHQEPTGGYKMSQVLRDLDRPVTAPLAQAPGVPARPVSRSLADIGRPPIGVSRPLADVGLGPHAEGDIILLRWLDDRSGSFSLYVGLEEQAEERFVADALEDPALAGRLQMATTEMSGQVVSTDYMPLDRYRALGIPAGGGSPHGEMLLSSLEADEWYFRANPQAKVAARVHVVVCDGYSCDEVERPLAEYRQAQERDPSFHVYPIELGRSINTSFTCQLSVAHKPRACPDETTAYKEAYSAVLQLLRAAAGGNARQVIGRTKSLNKFDLPVPTLFPPSGAK